MKILISTAVLALVSVCLAPVPAAAHCDGVDGPVVKAAERALETGNTAFVLIWVQQKDEAEILDAFRQTLAVRALNAKAQALADRYFFETVVRVHRAGEGEPYTGLKPAGRDLGPAIPAADRALESGSVEPLATLLAHAVDGQLRKRFDEARAAAAYTPDDVSSGRRYVQAYVEFIHYAERLYGAAVASADETEGLHVR